MMKSLEGNEDSDEDEGASMKKQRPLRVLVAAIHNEALKRFQEVVRDAKFSSDFF
jgi:hypothetical protein